LKSDQFQVHVAVEDRHWWFVGRRKILLDIASAVLPPSKDRLVIDVGCGTGANAAAFAHRYRCVGIDISDEAIQAAKSRFPGVEFICGAAPADLGDLARQADLFVVSDVIEHIADELRFVSDLVAAMKPGALLLITVPADPALWTQHDESFGHFRRYLPSTLREVWSSLPVSEIGLAAFNTRLYPAIKAVRFMNRKLGRTSGAAGTDFAMPVWPVNDLLTRVLAGESRSLVNELATGARHEPSRGVSLVAVLRREDGVVAKRSSSEQQAARPPTATLPLRGRE
jgi:SAM-dependent methyltransferase